MYWKNNWQSYNFDGVDNIKVKPTPTSEWNLKITKTIDRPVKSYQEEMLLNAQAVRDHFSEPLDLMLSGGVDSEIILQSYTKLKIPINVYIAKFGNINHTDYTEALKTCDIYGVTPKIIDFDIHKFVKTDAYDMWHQGYYSSVGNMINLKLTEYLDNIPIMGEGINAQDLVPINKTEWKIKIWERHYNCAFYSSLVDRTIISAWHNFTPELVASFLDLNLHKWKKHKIISPPFNLISMHTLKYTNYNRLFGTRIRKKLIGWERSETDRSPIDVIRNFNNTHILNKLKLKEYSWDINEFRQML